MTLKLHNSIPKDPYTKQLWQYNNYFYAWNNVCTVEYQPIRPILQKQSLKRKAFLDCYMSESQYIKHIRKNTMRANGTICWPLFHLPDDGWTLICWYINFSGRVFVYLYLYFEYCIFVSENTFVGLYAQSTYSKIHPLDQTFFRLFDCSILLMSLINYIQLQRNYCFISLRL